jgi:superfamily II DNA or RNA helicase
MKDVLPELVRINYRFDVAPNVQEEYEEIVFGMQQKSKTNYAQGSGGGRRRPDSSALEGLSKLRQLTSTAKIPATADLVMRKIDEEGHRHAVVFVWFKETAHSLAAEIRERARCTKICAVLSGDASYAERQVLVDQFQAGRLTFVSFYIHSYYSE